jgi:hypothetical protein
MNIIKGQITNTKSIFLIQTNSNIHYQNNERILELNKDELKKYFNVNEIIIKWGNVWEIKIWRK